jgi:hypothetical protein
MLQMFLEVRSEVIAHFGHSGCELKDDIWDLKYLTTLLNKWCQEQKL